MVTEESLNTASVTSPTAAGCWVGFAINADVGVSAREGAEVKSVDVLPLGSPRYSVGWWRSNCYAVRDDNRGPPVILEPKCKSNWKLSYRTSKGIHS